MSFYTTWECADYISTLLNANLISLGLNEVYELDQTMLPQFPSASVMEGEERRVYSGSHQFTLELRVVIYVLHGTLDETFTQRSREQGQKARNVINLLHSSRTLGGNVVQGWVESNRPIALPTQNAQVVTSQLSWVGEQRELLTT